MTRTDRLLRLARLRGDRAAVAILETQKGQLVYGPSNTSLSNTLHRDSYRQFHLRITIPETEFRALWGDR